jgi:hypothetical protein
MECTTYEACLCFKPLVEDYVWEIQEVNLKEIALSSVSQPAVRGPPVVRDDGTGGPQADLN